jgi:hypothetical protein
VSGDRAAVVSSGGCLGRTMAVTVKSPEVRVFGPQEWWW